MNTNTQATPSHFPLDAEACAAIRKALLIGLTCYGEIEERLSAQGIHEMGGETLPADVKVVHPTGCCTVPSTFAEALSYVSILENHA